MAYLEPFTASLLKPFNGSVPSLVYGTQFCEEKSRCCITGFDYVHVQVDCSLSTNTVHNQDSLLQVVSVAKETSKVGKVIANTKN